MKVPACAAEDPYNLRIIARPGYNAAVRLDPLTLVPQERACPNSKSPQVPIETIRPDRNSLLRPGRFCRRPETRGREGAAEGVSNAARAALRRAVDGRRADSDRFVRFRSIHDGRAIETSRPRCRGWAPTSSRRFARSASCNRCSSPRESGLDSSLLAGSHRLSAARQAGLATVPCLLVNADGEAARKLKRAGGAQVDRRREAGATTGADRPTDTPHGRSAANRILGNQHVDAIRRLAGAQCAHERSDLTGDDGSGCDQRGVASRDHAGCCRRAADAHRTAAAPTT